MDIFVATYMILTQFECGSQVRDFPLFVGQPSEERQLDSGEYTGLDSLITFHRKGWRGWKPLKLPEAFECAARRFLAEFHTPQDLSFDCWPRGGKPAWWRPLEPSARKKPWVSGATPTPARGGRTGRQAFAASWVIP